MIDGRDVDVSRQFLQRQRADLVEGSLSNVQRGIRLTGDRRVGEGRATGQKHARHQREPSEESAFRVFHVPSSRKGCAVPNRRK